MARKMNARIPAQKPTRVRLAAFAKAGGMNYDEAINLLLDMIINEGESVEEAAARLNYARIKAQKTTKPSVHK